MMTLEKWLKLILLIIIFGVMIKCINVLSLQPSISLSNTSSVSLKNSSCNDKCIINKGNNVNSCNSNNNSNNNSNSKGCKSCEKLLPVLDPRFNMREICKQSILLEDHLFQEEKRCYDCICKHFLTIEALAEEAITLDKEHKYPELNDLQKKIRTISKKYIDNSKDIKQNAITAQELREIRKGYMQKCFDAF
jgi:hypothetical protein